MIFPTVNRLRKPQTHVSRYIMAYIKQIRGEIMEANAPEANIMACLLRDTFLNDALSTFMPKTGNSFAKDEIKGKSSFVRLDLATK